MKRQRIGRALLKAGAAFTAVGGFLSDWNRTHLFNPAWTPHAKFHDAMSILLGSMLGGSSLYLLQKKEGNLHRQLCWAALLSSFFWAAMAGSFAFPGAKGLEAEFPELVPKAGGIRLNEGAASAFMLSVLCLGYVLAKKKGRRKYAR